MTMSSGERMVWAAEFVRSLSVTQSAGRERLAAQAASRAVEAVHLAAQAIEYPETESEHRLVAMAGREV